MAAWDWSAPLRIRHAHSGPVPAVATARLEDGRTLIISGATDGVLRRWDAATGEPVGDPLVGHAGWVRAVACARLDDGRILIIFGGNNGSLILWPLRPNGQVAYEPILAPRVRALSMVDDDTIDDVLNRGVLAAHLEGLLVQLTTKQRAGTAVVHIDGQWGAGKSTLVNLLVERLGSPHQPSEEPAEERLTDPVVVRYDAWRESTVAPEWWSLARSINMAVRSQRALATRIVMTVTGAVTRTVRSRPVLVAGAVLVAVLVAMLVAWASGVWRGDVGTVGTVLTTAATLATLGPALSRVLFWTSPAFGRLHQRADDNPLGEIAAAVVSLRQPTSPRTRIVSRWVGMTLLVAGAYVVLSPELATRWLPTLSTIQRHPGGWTVGVVLGCAVLYAWWTALRRHQPRRPILLVIDDLDRCSAERVVKLLETVHTLLREPAEARLLRVWRRPAPLIVLVLADGRWVRTAFETSYESFGTLGSPVHGLGADFLQKVFDHIVLVPALAADQVQSYVDHITGISAWAIAGRTVADQGPNRMPPMQGFSTSGQSIADTNGRAQSPPGEVEEPPISAAAAPRTSSPDTPRSCRPTHA